MLGLALASAALLLRRGSLDLSSGLYMIVSLMASEMAVLLTIGGGLLGAGFWLAGAVQQPAGQWALLLHGLAVAGLGLPARLGRRPLN